MCERSEGPAAAIEQCCSSHRDSVPQRLCRHVHHATLEVGLGLGQEIWLVPGSGGKWGVLEVTVNMAPTSPEATGMEADCSEGCCALMEWMGAAGLPLQAASNCVAEHKQRHSETAGPGGAKAGGPGLGL